MIPKIGNHDPAIHMDCGQMKSADTPPQLTIGTVLSLQDDEILYSWLGRLFRRNSFAPAKAAVNRFLGGSYRTLCVDLPTGLGNLQTTLGLASPLSASQDWIDRATLYPYHRPFLTPERDRIVRENMLCARAAGGAQKALMGRLANRFGAATSLRYCPLCVRADTIRHCEPYWRRSWLLPGVARCSTHGAVLVELAPATRPSNPFESRQLPLHPSVIGCVPCAEASMDWVFSKLSAELLQSNLPALRRDVLIATYRRRAVDLGHGCSTGRVRISKLAEAVREHYRDFEGFVHRDRLVQTQATPLGWLHTIFNKPDRAVHPVAHLMLIGHLFGSIATWRDALEAEDLLAPVLPAQKLNSRRASRPNEPELLDSSLSCRAAAIALGIDTATVVAYRRECGMPVTPRSHKTTRMVEGQIVNDLEAGMPLADIAANSEVSMTTVCRILRSNAEVQTRRQVIIHQANERKAKDEWLMAIRRADSITAARRIAPAGYAWLYRNDRAWIRANSNVLSTPTREAPRDARVDWAQRDLALSARVFSLQSSWVEQGATERLSAYRILRALGIQTSMIRNRHRLSLTYDALVACVETESMWRKRRLAAAAAQLVELELPLTTVRLCKTANINWTYRHWVAAWLNAHRRAP